MFTGIVEVLGEVFRVEKYETNVNFLIGSPIVSSLRIDQSLAHNGVCLTVTKITDGGHWVTAIDESMKRTNLVRLKIGDCVNLERCMPANGRFDGHVVQGHVDLTAVAEAIDYQNGSWLFTFSFKEKTTLLVEKGSVTINGISLTCFNIKAHSFQVAIIPYTYTHTNLGLLSKGDVVNIEFDIIGKYVAKILGERMS